MIDKIESHMLLWVNIEKRRYYRLRFDTDLLGQNFAVRTWGSLESGLGGVQIDPLKETCDIVKKIKEVTAARKRRGYVVIK